MKTNFLNIHDFVLLLTALECVFLAILLKTMPSKCIQPRGILAAFFIVITVDLATQLRNSRRRKGSCLPHMGNDKTLAFYLCARQPLSRVQITRRPKASLLQHISYRIKTG